MIQFLREIGDTFIGLWKYVFEVYSMFWNWFKVEGATVIGVVAFIASLVAVMYYSFVLGLYLVARFWR